MEFYKSKTPQFITIDFINKVLELMACGKSITQVAAALKISTKKFNSLTVINTENPDMQLALKEAIELGHTLQEAYYEDFYVDAMTGRVEGVKESLVKSFMQNKFKWNDKQTVEVVDNLSALPENELDSRINELLPKSK